MNNQEKAYDRFLKSCGEEEPDYEKAWFAGWKSAETHYKKRIKELEEYEWKYKELSK